MNTQDRTIRDWKPFETAPKDREILVYYTNQNVYLLVKYDDIHKHWTSKGIPKMGLENQRLLWIDIPELKQPEKQEIEIAEEVELLRVPQTARENRKLIIELQKVVNKLLEK